MRKNWKAILGVTLVFVFGWISGLLSSSLINQHRRGELFRRGPAGMAEAWEQRVTRNLNLDEQQQQQVHAIILDNMQQRERLQAQLQPQTQILKRQMNQQIEALLHSDQRETFRANLKSMRTKRGEKNSSNSPADNSSPAAK